MEKQDENILKVRGYRSIVAAAFRLYSRRFLPMLKSQWPYLLATALVTVTDNMLTLYQQYLSVPLVLLEGILELLLWLMTARWLTQRPLRNVVRTAWHHWFVLLWVTFVGSIFLIPLSVVLGLPQIILMLAHADAAQSTMLGDADGMPSSMPYMMAVVNLLTALMLLLLRLILVYVGYYAWGSAEAKKRERQAQLSTLNVRLS